MLTEEVRVRGGEQALDAERRHLLSVGVSRVRNLDKKSLSSNLIARVFVVTVILTDDIDLHVVGSTVGDFVVTAEVRLAPVGPLHLVVFSQRLNVHVDALRRELLLLLLELLHHLPLPAVALLSLELLLRYRLPGARLWVRIVGRTSGPLLGVFPLSVLRSAVLEPDL